jgi:tripeptide aminopeptidase
MLATLRERNLPHPPLTVLFTVREESGLWGARFVDAAELGHPNFGFNVDGKRACDLNIGAVGAERWEVDVAGRAAHAGAYPEQGISATMVAALALAHVKNNGWFGKIVKGKKTGTSNVGSFGGQNGTCAGEATNVVTDYVLMRGEARSHDSRFVRAITDAYRDAFARAAAEVLDHRGRRAKVRFRRRRDYYPFRLKPDNPAVQLAVAAATRAGLEASLQVTNGGLDANWTVRHGIPTVTFGAGQNQIHTVDEFVDVDDFLAGCRYALALATQP